ncbi:MAG: TlpA family protein disulfide reductase [Akkermansiaceae bacterium]|nr:TlpA family protein disulfide reductase [Akkermansiaceae bacterium]
MNHQFAGRLAAALLAFVLAGLPTGRGQGEDAPPLLSPRENLVRNLFESENARALAANIAAAEKAGIARQAILEARFLFLIDQEDFAEVAALAPVLEKQKKSFRLEDSEIFSVPEEFFAIIEYCHALAALEKGDQADFKKHITEAFWLSPRQAAAFAPHIEGLRLEQAMAGLRIDLNRKFRQQSGVNEVTLATLANNSKHLLLHFWSPWSAECEANLPDFVAMAQELTRNNVPVVSILIEPGTEAVKMARDYRAGIKETKAGSWIVDNSERSLARTLRVQDVPTVALLSSEGAVLYNGHPSGEGLWTALRQAAPGIERPRLEPLP